MAHKNGAPADAARAADHPDDCTPSADLNPRQRAFVVEYLKDKNATQAYLRVYGGSSKVAEGSGPRLLGNARVKAEVARLERQALAKVQQETGITLERTLRQIAAGAFHDPRKFFDADGKLLPITDLDDDTATALAGFDVQEFGKDGDMSIKKIKLADRKGYLDMLMKHLGGYGEDNIQKREDLSTQLAGFIAQIHESGSCRLPVVQRQAK